MHEVAEFVVAPPVGQARAVECAEARLAAFLEERFPRYGFRFLWGEGCALAEDGEFAVIPIMNRAPKGGELKDPDEILMGKLDPRAIGEIRQALSEFDINGRTAN